MPEKEEIFGSKIKYSGLLSFKDFYKFCYDWLKDEKDLNIIEEKYQEKLLDNFKNIEIKWTAFRKVTDYFKFQIKVEFLILRLTEVEVVKDGQKIKMNKGEVEIKVKGTLIRDYEGKFEKDAFRKFLRGVYEKWVFPARVEQYENSLIGTCDEFLSQTKAYLDMEANR